MLKAAVEDAQVNSEALEKLARVTGELDVTRRRLETAEEAAAGSSTAAAARVAELEAEVQKGEAHRRRMHNQIQELRGNVRVFARVRPFLPDDNADAGASGGGGAAARVRREGRRPRPDAHAAGGCGFADRRRGARAPSQLFAFDKAFGQSAGQEVVFTEVSEFVQSALDEYNVCLFSCGQTGSGKAHTMQGSGDGRCAASSARSRGSASTARSSRRGAGTARWT